MQWCTMSVVDVVFFEAAGVNLESTPDRVDLKVHQR